MAFLSGLGSILLVKLLSTVRGRTSMLTLVLAGVVISAFFSAAISIAKLMADPFQKLPAITYWLMGSIASSDYLDVLLVAVAVVPSAAAIYLLRFQINVMSLGEEKARALGTRVLLVQWIILLASALISAGVVATSGIIGWVGLVIPHVARALVGADHQRLLPVSGAVGRHLFADGRRSGANRVLGRDPARHHHRADRRSGFAVILRRLHAKGGWAND